MSAPYETEYWLDADNCTVYTDCKEKDTDPCCFGPYEGPFPAELLEDGTPDYCEECGMDLRPEE